MNRDKYESSLIAVTIVLVIFGYYFLATPSGRTYWNKWFYDVQKADDSTNYETIKEVEDTCRSMIASYESDKLTYEMYKDSDDREKQEWGEQARMRANKTASTYNNYILKNSFVWEDNIPDDILDELPFIGGE